jgi:hypothetical protein
LLPNSNKARNNTFCEDGNKKKLLAAFKSVFKGEISKKKQRKVTVTKGSEKRERDREWKLFSIE